MNKEKEALLKEILAQPDIPRKVSPKSVLRFVNGMQPETQEMRDYLMAIFSAETQAERNAFRDAWYTRMTLAERKAFEQAYYRCCMTGLNTNRVVPSEANVEAFAPSV
jgi:hypothetical protein